MVRARGGLLGRAYHASRRPASSRATQRTLTPTLTLTLNLSLSLTLSLSLSLSLTLTLSSAPGPAVEWRSAEPLLLLPSRWRAGEASREAFREESGEALSELTKEPPREVTGEWW